MGITKYQCYGPNTELPESLPVVSRRLSSLTKRFPPEKRATTSSLEFENSITRALGVKWDLQEDNFMYTGDSISSDTCTKRQILKKTSTVFDPLGFLTPFTLVAKIIIQDLWRKNVGWDEEVDKSIQNAWKIWMQELSKIAQAFRVPRSFDIQPTDEIQLHLFSDASEQAFGAVAYLSIQTPSNTRCHLVIAKSRVAPIKPLTHPRLEIQGAVLAIRFQ